MSHGERKRVLIASGSDWSVKGTDIAIRALSKVKDEVDVSIIAYGKDFNKTIALSSSLGLRLKVLPKVPHERLNKYYWNADVVIDQFKLGSLGMVSLEAIACGRPVITYVSSKYPEYRDFPLKDISTEERARDAICTADIDLWKRQYAYFESNHNVEKIVKKLMEIYNETFMFGKV
jgi:glycosyltransferase involved in cell wall biosynthesis